MRAITLFKMFQTYLEVKKTIKTSPTDREAYLDEALLTLVPVYAAISKIKKLLPFSILDAYPVTKAALREEADFWKEDQNVYFALGIPQDLDTEKQKEIIMFALDDYLRVVQLHKETEATKQTEFRILHWGLLARRFLEIVKTAKVNYLGQHSWDIQLSGIDLASIYKRNLVDKLDGYPETVKEMCAYWDQVGLTGISSLTECSDYPMTEEGVIEALGRVKKHLDEFESEKEKGVN